MPLMSLDNPASKVAVPGTPETVRYQLDTAIDRLNARWDLELPKLRGAAALKAQVRGASRSGCTGRLHYLSFRLSRDSMERLLDSFDQFAKTAKTNWVLKPKQETGTLPTGLNSESALYKDALSNPFKPTSEQRQSLIEHLHELLDESVQLSRDSDAYELQKASPRVQKVFSGAATTVHNPETPATSPAKSAEKPRTPGSMKRERGHSPSFDVSVCGFLFARPKLTLAC